MDGLVFDLTGVILQVLCLLAALCNLGVEAAALVLQVQSKDKPRSPKGTNRDPNKSEPPKQVRGPWGVTSSLRLAALYATRPRSFNRLP